VIWITNAPQQCETAVAVAPLKKVIKHCDNVIAEEQTKQKKATPKLYLAIMKADLDNYSQS